MCAHHGSNSCMMDSNRMTANSLDENATMHARPRIIKLKSDCVPAITSRLRCLDSSTSLLLSRCFNVPARLSLLLSSDVPASGGRHCTPACFSSAVDMASERRGGERLSTRVSRDTQLCKPRLPFVIAAQIPQPIYS